MGNVIKREIGIEIQENCFSDGSSDKIIEKIRAIKQKCLKEDNNNQNNKEEDLNNIDISQNDMESESNYENDKKNENCLIINTNSSKKVI